MAPAVVNEDEVYDYIVCGGGTSGCAVAGRLAEDPSLTVCVIEAGPDNADLENVHMAGGWSQNFDKETDWNLVTKPAPGINDRVVKASRGKFLGGSSGVNGTVCIRGTKQDYDDWQIPGWDGEEMFKYMAKAESFHGKGWFDADKRAHGFDGPLNVEPHDLAPISELVMKSYQDLGMPYDADMFTHGRTSHGCGHAPRTVFQGVRTTGADFITKSYRNDRISIVTDTTVDKIILDESNGKVSVSGVTVFTKDGGSRKIRARREVIISGGSYCSPAVLLRSGIGPKSELEALKIPCAIDLPGVGKNLMDHLIVFIFYEVNQAGITNDHLVYHGDSFTSSYQQYKEKKTGFLSTFPFGAFAFARLDERLKDERLWREAKRLPGRDPMGLTKDQPNIELFHTECYGGPKQFDIFPVNDKHAFCIIPELFAPRSRGSVTLKSSDPNDLPVVDHNYLNDPLDLLVLSEACRLGNEVVVRGKGTKDVIKGSWPETLAHHKYTTREDWVSYVKENATTCYHPGGTCKMGTADDKMAVVDERLRVRGVTGLRVADCSIMPLLNQGHTQMPAYAIGEKAADMIKQDWARK